MQPGQAVAFCRQLFILAGAFAMAILSVDCSAIIPEVKIATGPLYAGGNVHPNMLMNLSTEFSIAAMAYRNDLTYNRNDEYPGYFNPLKCYRYVGGIRNIRDGYFSISKDADALHECGGEAFSGNFMNWAASSTIDVLRYALTGGDRIVDAANMTVLQRAVLGEDFYANEIYFPRRIIKSGANVSAPNRVTPFNVDPLYIVSCRNRILFSDSINSGNDCDTQAIDKNGVLAKTDKKLGEYLARVKVCDSMEGAARSELCRKYGTYYKPVGEMQRHSERIRFAVMGYLLDHSEKRYGGVLRAPMKYIGPAKFVEPGFNEVANENTEWDVATGVSYANPEDGNNRSSASSHSGVINYLNKFGRTGIYKNFDPVSELYYEGLRYFQGKQATTDALAGINGAMKEGFPVIENWKDPVAASCQKNYIVAIADANSHWDRYIPGNTRTTFNGNENTHDLMRAVEAGVVNRTPPLDAKPWTAKVGEMEADSAGFYTNPTRRPHLARLHEQDTGYGGHGTYYMAGLAYWANTQDIRLDKPIRVKTFVIDIDEGGNGLIDNSSRSLKPRDSQLYLAAKYGGFNDKNKDGNPFITYADDGKTTVSRSNTEWDGAGTGVPANYVLGGRPKELIQSVRNIFSRIVDAGETASGASISSTEISSGGTFIYQAGFDASAWSGSLKKFKLNLNQDGEVDIATTAEWDAGKILNGINGQVPKPAPDDRKIYTLKRNADKSSTTVAFKWAELATDQHAFLNTSAATGIRDGLGEQRLNYLRGVRDLEAGKANGIFRARTGILGDIINSSPVYVGPPAWMMHGHGYQKFHDDNKHRPHAVYVGANDGMLHAFSAADGAELFAYIPNALIRELNQLSRPDYVHRPYVDGELSVSEALAGGQWKTVLASGMGGGAQGVFALDVSNPASFGSGAGALWEFTDADDADMGNLTGAPQIAKLKTKIVNGVPEYRYFVLVPSGLNNYKNDGMGKFNDTGQGALFLLSLDKSPSEKWIAGVNYYKIRTPITDANLPNGLASPALVTGSDGALRYAYAGDLQGNLWRFYFNGTAPWTNALGASPQKPLFTARDGKNSRQPITMQAKVVFAPGGGYVILFGTGKFIEPADAAPGNFRSQSFYGIYDSTNASYKVNDRSELVPRSLTKTHAQDGNAFEIVGNAFGYEASEGRKGWYFDFPVSEQTGERSVSNPLVAYGKLFFNTLIPGGDPCTAGTGRSYSVDALTGLPPIGMSTGYLSAIPLVHSPIVLETGSEIVERSPIGRRKVKKKYSVINSGAGGTNGTAGPSTGNSGGSRSLMLPAGRLSWREVINWQELRDAFNKK